MIFTAAATLRTLIDRCKVSVAMFVNYAEMKSTKSLQKV